MGRAARLSKKKTQHKQARIDVGMWDAALDFTDTSTLRAMSRVLTLK